MEPRMIAVGTVVAIALSTLLAGAAVGAAAGKAIADGQARVAEAQAQAVDAAAAAGPDAVREVMAPEVEKLATLGEQLTALPAPYCDGDSDLYDRATCASERICTRADMTKDGGGAVACERWTNAALSVTEIETVEGGNASDALREERRAVFTRRK